MRFSIVSGGICIYSCSLALVPGSVPSCLEYPSTTLTCSGMSGASTENATKSWCSGVETDKTTHNLIPAECWLDSIAISRIFSSSAVSTHHKWDGGGQHALDMLMITSLVPRRRSSDERSTRIPRESCGNLIILRCHWWLKRHNSFISGHAKWPCGSVSLWIIISRSSSSGNWWWLCRIGGLHRNATIALIIVMHADCRWRRKRGHCNWRVLQELTAEGEQRFNSRNHLTQMPVSGSLIIPFADSIAGLDELEYLPGDYYILHQSLLYSVPSCASSGNHASLGGRRFVLHVTLTVHWYWPHPSAINVRTVLALLDLRCDPHDSFCGCGWRRDEWSERLPQRGIDQRRIDYKFVLN